MRIHFKVKLIDFCMCLIAQCIRICAISVELHREINESIHSQFKSQVGKRKLKCFVTLTASYGASFEWNIL